MVDAEIASPRLPLCYAGGAAPVAAWNGLTVAVIVAVFPTAAMLRFTKWEEWISIAAGFWSIISPWVLDYTSLLGNAATLPQRSIISPEPFIIILSLVQQFVSDVAPPDEMPTKRSNVWADD